MKKYLIGSFALLITSGIYSCKDTKPNNELIEQTKDSIRQVYPASYIGINIQDHNDVTITLGSEAYFNGPEEKRKEITDALSKISVHFFEENNYLDEGKVIFVPNETTIPTDSDPKKEYEFDFKPLLKK